MPKHKSEALEEYQFQETGLYRLGSIAVVLTVGWPLYLFFNASGRKYDRFANHFDPYSPIFSKRERIEILISDAALIAVFGSLTGLAQNFGWLWLLKVGFFSLIAGRNLGYYLSLATFLVHHGLLDRSKPS